MSPDELPPHRPNQAHAAMWVVGPFLLIAGLVLIAAGLNAVRARNDAESIAQGNVLAYLGSGLGSLGLLLFIIAWTIAAARR